MPGFSLSLTLWVAVLSLSPKRSVTSIPLLSRSGCCVFLTQSKSSCSGGEAVRAPPPVDDLGLADLEAGVCRRRQTGGVAHRAIDVGDGPAPPADQVVMVVPRLRLVARDRPRRLERGEGAGAVRSRSTS